MAEFTHFKKDGSAVMVDVHEKPDTYLRQYGITQRKKEMSLVWRGSQVLWGRRRMRS